ncbi:MAG: hypothetical protein L0229_27590 [Blastocatellia bacterium]|nr:hypothetical protein [Blastocatellia bacterium]
MQSTDEATGSVASQYTDHAYPLDDLKPYPMPIRVVAVVVAWLVPGGGHLVLGRFGRAALFFALLAGAFVFGLILNGRLFWPVADTEAALGFDLVTVLWSFAQIGAGLCYIVSYLLGIGTEFQAQAATFDYGNTFMILAGLLNYLVIHDAFDIAAGRKH